VADRRVADERGSPSKLGPVGGDRMPAGTLPLAGRDVAAAWRDDYGRVRTGSLQDIRSWQQSDMATERQIAASRRNAGKSTGPRSRGGKKRAGRNAYRHGLASGITSSAASAEQLDKLARKIAGDTEDAIILERARAAAEAEPDLARVRRAKVALIERVRAFGDLDPPQAFNRVHHAIRFPEAFERGRGSMPDFLKALEPIDASVTIPSEEPNRSTEAIRRAQSELLKLDRYERRASTLRDQAVRGIARGRRIS
jgi:hypothetical protein